MYYQPVKLCTANPLDRTPRRSGKSRPATYLRRHPVSERSLLSLVGTTDPVQDAIDRKDQEGIPDSGTAEPAEPTRARTDAMMTAHPDPRIWVSVIPADELDRRGLTLPTSCRGTKVVTAEGMHAGGDVTYAFPWATWARHGREVHVVAWDCDDEFVPVVPGLDEVRAQHPNLEVTTHLADGHTWRDLNTDAPLFVARTAHEEKVRAKSADYRATEEAKRNRESGLGLAVPRLRRVGERTRPPTRALVPGVILSDTDAELLGENNAGKTALAIDLAMRLCLGLEWAGKPLTPARVAYLVGEGGGDLFDIRVDAWLAANGFTRDDVADRFLVVDPSAPIGSTAWRGLVEGVAEFGPALVVIDTRTAHLMPGDDENAVSVATTMLHALKGLRDRCGGAATLMLHHPNRAGGTDGRGSGAWDNAADTRLFARRKGAEVTLSVSKQRHLPAGGKWTFATAEVPVAGYGDLTSAVVATSVQAAEDKAQSERAAAKEAEREARADEMAAAKLETARAALVRLVTDANAKGEMPSGRALIAAAKGEGIARKPVRDALAQLCTDGTFRKLPGDRGAELYELAQAPFECAE